MRSSNRSSPARRRLNYSADTGWKEWDINLREFLLEYHPQTRDLKSRRDRNANEVRLLYRFVTSTIIIQSGAVLATILYRT